MTPVVFINSKGIPFVDLIMSGKKAYETRTRNTLGRFIGDQILIAETGHGKPLVRAVATIDHSIAVFDRDLWDTQYSQGACIPSGSGYDWHDDTKVKWLYYLKDVCPVAPFRLPDTAVRHGRTWAEYPGDISC